MGSAIFHSDNISQIICLKTYDTTRTGRNNTLNAKHNQYPFLIRFTSRSNHRYWEWNECLNIKICNLFLVSN